MIHLPEAEYEQATDHTSELPLLLSGLFLAFVAGLVIATPVVMYACGCFR